MRRMLICVVAGVLAAAIGGAQSTAPAKKKAPAKAGPSSSAGHSATAGAKKPAASSRTTRTAASRRGAPAQRTTWRNRQMAPAPERYKEIQEALAAKGYLSPEEANGSWTPSSMEALKKFQSEQNLESTGKINSLSLIALGLGPKHDTPAAKPPAPPAQAQELPSPGRQ